MQIITRHSVATAPDRLVADLFDSMTDMVPRMIVLYLSVDLPADMLLRELRSRWPSCIVQGGTSCGGVMTDKGFHAVEGNGAGLLAIIDDEGAYGAAAAPIGEDPAAAASLATEQALAVADRPGEVPSLIWLSAAPGNEEALLQGIEAVVGPNVPVVGGSTADNDVSGRWRQFCGTESHANAVTVGVLFPVTPVTSAFRSGYGPTGHQGVVTHAAHRTILTIDGEPAADVYERWIGRTLQREASGDTNVLFETTLDPIGREVGRTSGIASYNLSHPEAITADGGLRLFTDIAVGDRITLMTGSFSSLVTRAGRVARFAANNAEMRTSDIAGALVIYCAGCMLTVGEGMPAVPHEISAAIGGAPFLGAFTFGEQGCMRGGRNCHGNLLISAVLFGR